VIAAAADLGGGTTLRHRAQPELCRSHERIESRPWL
jgi:hypothetical protein